MEISSIKALFWIGDVPITNTMVNTWLFMGIILIVFFVLTRNLSLVPQSKGQVLAEMIVGAIDGFAESAGGKKAKDKYAPYFLSLFSFFIVCNWSGFMFLGIFRAPTADIATMLPLSLATVYLMESNKIKTNGIGGYIKSFFEPFFLFLPMNIFGTIAPIISLALRMFGNLFAGIVISTLFYQLYVNNGFVVAYTCMIGLVLVFLVATGNIKKIQAALKSIDSKFARRLATTGLAILCVPILAATFIHGYFDLFSGFIQSLIFTMLAVCNIGDAMGGE